MVLNELYKLCDDFDVNGYDRLVLILAGLYHDYGKPRTTFTDAEGRIRARHHEEVGCNKLAFELKDLLVNLDDDSKVVNDAYHTVLMLVKYHYLPKHLVKKSAGQKEHWFYNSQFLPNSQSCISMHPMDMIYYLEIADMKGRICDDMEENLEYMELFKMQYEEVGALDCSLLGSDTYNVGYGRQHLASGKMFMPEEIQSVTFDHVNSYDCRFVRFW